MGKITYNCYIKIKKDKKMLDFKKLLSYNQVVACEMRTSCA